MNTYYYILGYAFVQLPDLIFWIHDYIKRKFSKDSTILKNATICIDTTRFTREAFMKTSDHEPPQSQKIKNNGESMEHTSKEQTKLENGTGPNTNNTEENI